MPAKYLSLPQILEDRQGFESARFPTFGWGFDCPLCGRVIMFSVY